MQTPNDNDWENLKAVLVWVLMCLGLSFSVAIVVKLFASNPQPATTTTINNYFIGNKEVNNGISKQFDGY